MKSSYTLLTFWLWLDSWLLVWIFDPWFYYYNPTFSSHDLIAINISRERVLILSKTYGQFPELTSSEAANKWCNETTEKWDIYFLPRSGLPGLTCKRLFETLFSLSLCLSLTHTQRRCSFRTIYSFWELLLTFLRVQEPLRTHSRELTRGHALQLWSDVTWGVAQVGREVFSSLIRVRQRCWWQKVRLERVLEGCSYYMNFSALPLKLL